jgi:hypothetical protein
MTNEQIDKGLNDWLNAHRYENITVKDLFYAGVCFTEQTLKERIAQELTPDFDKVIEAAVEKAHQGMIDIFAADKPRFIGWRNVEFALPARFHDVLVCNADNHISIAQYYDGLHWESNDNLYDTTTIQYWRELPNLPNLPNK